jgi:hypothetical protein
VQAAHQVAKIEAQNGWGYASLRSVRLLWSSHYVWFIKQPFATTGVKNSLVISVSKRLLRLPTASIERASGGALAHWADIALACFSISS